MGVAFGVWLLSLYRVTFGAVIPTCCIHYPSCSQYAETAIKTHGLLRGARLSIGRLLRCHPFGRGGFDPVP